MKIILSIILSIFLTSCTWPIKPEPVIEPAKVIKIDKAVLLTCDLLKEDVILATFPDILVAYSDIATKYADCAGKQNNSIKLLKEFGNIK